jgi:hypothetical protein
MVYSDMEVVQLTAGLFKQKSDRDKQYKVGASNISNPCTRHLAHDLLGTPEQESKYWMGAKIGTAIHSFLEDAMEKSVDKTFADAIVEQKIILGELPNYGVINSKPDLVLPHAKQLLDWKTTSRSKVKKLQNLVAGLKDDEESKYTLQKYIGQAQLYGWGMNRSGVPIERITLVFINRDGTYENDIWAYGVDYDEDFAKALWSRLENLWSELESGAHPDNYANNKYCFKCNING